MRPPRPTISLAASNQHEFKLTAAARVVQLNSEMQKPLSLDSLEMWGKEVAIWLF